MADDITLKQVRANQRRWLYGSSTRLILVRWLPGLWIPLEQGGGLARSAQLCNGRLHRRPAGGLLHHSDRGSQYAAHDYRLPAVARFTRHDLQHERGRRLLRYDTITP